MLALPYYFNLAPNYDATLTGILYGERGLMLDGEFRYLTASSHGSVDASWLPDDRKTNSDRGSVDIKSFTSLSPHWYVNVDINRVSDAEYFQDFSNQSYGTAIGVLASTAGIYGRGRYWTAGAFAQVWQVTDPSLTDLNEPYRRLPDLYFRWQQPFAEHLELGVKTEAVKFDSRCATAAPDDLYPSRLPFEQAAWYVKPELTTVTAYNPTRPSYRAAIPARPAARRSSISMRALISIATRRCSATTREHAEPRLYYLRVPYRNLDDILIFDTGLHFSYEQRSHEQLRRRGSAVRCEPVDCRVTTRLLDAEDGREWVTASFGQIITSICRACSCRAFHSSTFRVAITFWIRCRADDRWTIGGSYLFDPHNDQTDLGRCAQYRFGQEASSTRRIAIDADWKEAHVSFIYPLTKLAALGRWDYSLRGHHHGGRPRRRRMAGLLHGGVGDGP